MYFSLLEVTNIFVLRISGNCDVRGVRTTTVRDITMMYSQEWHMENVPLTLTFHIHIDSDCVGAQSLLSKDIGEEAVTLLPAARLLLPLISQKA